MWLRCHLVFRRISYAPWLRVVAAWLAIAVGPSIGGAEPRTLTNAWSFLIGNFSESSPAIGEDGTIYFGTWKGEFVALNENGSPKWLFRSAREIHSSPAIGPDNTVYFGSRDRRLYALRADGTKKWEFKTGAWVDSSPAVGEEGTIFFGSWDTKFYGLKPDGAELWDFPTKGPIVCSPAIGQRETIYFGSHDGHFYALSPNGSQLWQFTTGGPIISSPAIDRDGTIYTTSVDGFLYALTDEGAQKWKLKTGGVTESSPVIGQDGTIFVAVNQDLWAVSPQGQRKWVQPFGQELIIASPVALADGSVCCVSRQGLLINLGSPGRFNWTYDQRSCGIPSPALAPNGTIYTCGHVLGIGTFLFGVPAGATLAQSTWPTFRGGCSNAGRVKRKPDTAALAPGGLLFSRHQNPQEGH